MKPKKSLPVKKQADTPSDDRPSIHNVKVTDKQVAAMKNKVHLLDGKGSMLQFQLPKTKKP